MDTLVSPEDVSSYYAEHGVDLADAYAFLLVSNGHQVWLPPALLREAAARVLSGALNALHTHLRLGHRPLDLFDRLTDPVRFAWACLRTHVARLACDTLA